MYWCILFVLTFIFLAYILFRNVFFLTLSVFNSSSKHYLRAFTCVCVCDLLLTLSSLSLVPNSSYPTVHPCHWRAQQSNRLATSRGNSLLIIILCCDLSSFFCWLVMFVIDCRLIHARACSSSCFFSSSLNVLRWLRNLRRNRRR